MSINWKRVGNNFKSGTGVSIAAMVVLLATHGPGLLTAIKGIPVLLAAFSTGLPFGAWSGTLATMIAGGFHLFARSWHSRSFAIELATILVGTTAVLLQVVNYTRAELLSALVVGLVAGFGGLFSSKLLRALFVQDKTDES